MLKMGLLLGFLLFVLIYIGVTYWYTKRLIIVNRVGSTNAHITNLRVTMQLILLVLPITVILLGILGFGSIVELKEFIDDEIQRELKASEMTSEYIDSLKSEAEKSYQQIKKMSENLDMLNLPVGTIVAYYGDKQDIDEKLESGYWAICDGNVHNGIGTPDLREKFILGADWQTMGKHSTTHIHNQLTLSDVDTFIINIRGGNRPIQTFRIPRYSKLSPIDENVNPLPPYYTLVYLMKLK